MTNPVLKIDMGPMVSGKSQELIRRCSKMVDALASIEPTDTIQTVLFITDVHQKGRKVESEDRGITTHASNFKPSKYLKICEVEKLGDISEETLENVSFIGIDEAFYPDLYEKVLDWFLVRKISISISSIDGDFEQHIFSPALFRLIPYATQVVKHSAYCYFCLKESKKHENAYYTIRVDGSSSVKKEYAGTDVFKPACFHHMLEHRKQNE